MCYPPSRELPAPKIPRGLICASNAVLTAKYEPLLDRCPGLGEREGRCFYGRGAAVRGALPSAPCAPHLQAERPPRAGRVA